MFYLIKNIIERFGGREPGSRQEHDAQIWMKEKFGEFCEDVKEHHFTAALTAMFWSLKIFCLLFYITLILFWYSIPATAIVGVINIIVFLGHFVTYRQWLDPLFPKQKSFNVIATLEPQEEVRSTVLVAGHIDSTREFIWWYRLKDAGGYLSFTGGFMFLLSTIFFVATWISNLVPTCCSGWPFYVWLTFVIFSPVTIVLFNVHGKKVVDGAIDNLTGVAMAYGIGKALWDETGKGKSTLKHTRLRLISFGCEEPGLKGSQAYVKDHFDELRKENAVLLNIDGIKNKEDLRVVRGEIFTLVNYPKDFVSEVEDSFKVCQVPYKNVLVPVGASDGSSFAWKNIPAVCIIGMSTERLDPTYHTRLDTIDNLDPEGIEALKTVLVHFIREWDGKLK